LELESESEEFVLVDWILPLLTLLLLLRGAEMLLLFTDFGGAIANETFLEDEVGVLGALGDNAEEEAIEAWPTPLDEVSVAIGIEFEDVSALVVGEAIVVAFFAFSSRLSSKDRVFSFSTRQKDSIISTTPKCQNKFQYIDAQNGCEDKLK
jgi:hypothetical protein